MFGINTIKQLKETTREYKKYSGGNPIIMVVPDFLYEECVRTLPLTDGLFEGMKVEKRSDVGQSIYIGQTFEVNQN